jgi:ribosome biogenesis GTPase A
MSDDTHIVKINAAFATDIGLKRKLNEDSGLASFPIFAVADGMGGHDSGEIASAIVIEELRKLTDADNWQELTDAQLVTLIGKKRGCLIPGGIVDNERVSNLLIDEFRAGKIGRLTIDLLPESKQDAPAAEKPVTPEQAPSAPAEAIVEPLAKEDDHAEL